MAFSALLIWEDLFSLFSILVRSFPEPWWASFPSRSPLSDSHMNRCSECEFSFWDEPVIQHSSSHESKAALFRDVWTWLVLVLVLMVSGSLRLQRVALLAPAFRAGAAAGWPGLRLRAASQGQDLVWPFHSSVAVNAPGAQTLSPDCFVAQSLCFVPCSPLSISRQWLWCLLPGICTVVAADGQTQGSCPPVATLLLEAVLAVGILGMAGTLSGSKLLGAEALSGSHSRSDRAVLGS